MLALTSPPWMNRATASGCLARGNDSTGLAVTGLPERFVVARRLGASTVTASSSREATSSSTTEPSVSRESATSSRVSATRSPNSLSSTVRAGASGTGSERGASAAPDDFALLASAPVTAQTVVWWKLAKLRLAVGPRWP